MSHLSLECGESLTLSLKATDAQELLVALIEFLPLLLLLLVV